MSESELLASGSFLAFCAEWQADRRCPYGMADWALENVGELAYEACVWAWEKEERDDERFRPFEMRNGWNWCSLTYGEAVASDAPLPVNRAHDSFPAAIAYYLTHFDVELAKRYPPKVESMVPA